MKGLFAWVGFQQARRPLPARRARDAAPPSSTTGSCGTSPSTGSPASRPLPLRLWSYLGGLVAVWWRWLYAALIVIRTTVLGARRAGLCLADGRDAVFRRRCSSSRSACSANMSGRLSSRPSIARSTWCTRRLDSTTAPRSKSGAKAEPSKRCRHRDAPPAARQARALLQRLVARRPRPAAALRVVGVTATLGASRHAAPRVEHAASPAIANGIAFVTALSVTYFGQALWVFRRFDHSLARLRRFAVSVVGGSSPTSASGSSRCRSSASTTW